MELRVAIKPSTGNGTYSLAPVGNEVYDIDPNGIRTRVVGLKSRCPTDPTDGTTSTYDPHQSCEAQCEAPNPGNDPELTVIVDAWPHLSHAQRTRVMGIIEGEGAGQ